MVKANDQYDPKVLRKLQLAELTIFEDFIKICEENNIDYFLSWGCAIGMARHNGGFIPWDDDIDIGMLRADYDKFLEICRRDWSDKYDVLDIDWSEKFPFYNAEIVRKGTKNVPVVFKEANVPMGIDIALYPFDNVADGKWARKKQLFSVFFWHKIRILRDLGKPVLFVSGWKKQLVSAICVVANKVLKWTHFSRKFINKRYMKNATRYNNKETEWVSCFFDTTPMMSAMKREDLFPLKESKFEYLTVKIPKENDKFLRHLYGDYMQMPPEEKRKNHVPYILEFGPFEDLEIDQ